MSALHTLAHAHTSIYSQRQQLDPFPLQELAVALETHVVFAYANMHSECNAGKFCYLHQQLAFRYVAAVHGALCKYAHIPLPLFEIADLLFALDIAICQNNAIGGQPSVIVCLCTFVGIFGSLCFVNMLLWSSQSVGVQCQTEPVRKKKKRFLLNQLITGAMYHLRPEI